MCFGGSFRFVSATWLVHAGTTVATVDMAIFFAVLQGLKQIYFSRDSKNRARKRKKRKEKEERRGEERREEEKREQERKKRDQKSRGAERRGER